MAAFVIAFVIARAVSDGGSPDPSAPPAPRSHAPVAIDNLERMPDIKPLRSVAGAPPPADVPAGTVPAQGAQ